MIEFICKCGKSHRAHPYRFKNGDVFCSRECANKYRKKPTIKKLDLIGQRFGRWLVIDFAPSVRQTKFKCACDCGNTRDVFGTNLVRGKSISCGCHKSELQSTHGMSGTRLYTTWQKMKERCYKPGTESYHNYGFRGIEMCQEWLESFEKFKNWALQNGHSDELEIDRIDVNEDYKPSNCRWVTHKENLNNKRDNKLITVDGITKTVSQWADEKGILYGTLQSRLRYGWTGSRLFAPINIGCRSKRRSQS